MAFAVAMVITLYVGIVVKSALKISKNCFVCRTGYSTSKLNISVCKSHLCSAANTAANKEINSQICKHTCKSAMTMSLGANDFAAQNFTVIGVVNFKLLGMSKVLENLTVFVGYCNFHKFLLLHFPASKPDGKFLINNIHFCLKLFFYIKCVNIVACAKHFNVFIL